MSLVRRRSPETATSSLTNPMRGRRGNPQVIGLILPRLNRPPHRQASTASRPIDARLLLIDRLQI
jgi:hypothetical protein